MKVYLDNDIELIKQAFDEVEVTLSDELVDKTLKTCFSESNSRVKESKEVSMSSNTRNVQDYNKYIKIASVVICCILITVTFGIHLEGNCLGALFHENGICNSPTPCNYHEEQPDVKYKLKYSMRLEQHSIIGLNKLRDKSDNLIRGEVLSFTSAFKNINGITIPVTYYKILVRENIDGQLNKGDTFILESNGGYFAYKDLISKGNLINGDVPVDLDEDSIIEVITDAVPNLEIGEEYIVFMNKSTDLTYRPTGVSVFEIENDVVNLSHYINKIYNIENLPSYMSLKEFIDIIL